MNPPLTPELLDSLRRLDACTLANAIETFQVRLRNEGFTDGSIRCLFPSMPPMVGYAATLKFRGSQPPMGDRPYARRTDWWNYILTLPAPRVIVAQDISTRRGLGTLLGPLHMNIQRALDCIGIVTDGSVRGLPTAEELGFHAFASSVCVSHAYTHIVELGTPVEVGGLTVRSGDLIHGDQHGVQTVPREIAPQLPDAAARIEAEKQALIALCRSPEFSVEKLRAALAQHHA